MMFAFVCMLFHPFDLIADAIDVDIFVAIVGLVACVRWPVAEFTGPVGF